MPHYRLIPFIPDKAFNNRKILKKSTIDVPCFVVCYFMSIQFCNHLDGEERADCFAWFVFLVSCGCCVTLPSCAMGLSAVCDCGVS